MKIQARVVNTQTGHQVTVSTGEAGQSLSIPAKTSGGGSAVNGGEFLMLALATCYCNDLYREAKRLNLDIRSVEVEAAAEFNGVGLAAENIVYSARVQSPEPAEKIERLLRETDAVAEVHNTIRAGGGVRLLPWSSEA